MSNSDYFIPIDVIDGELSRVVQARWLSLFDSSAAGSICGNAYTLRLGGATVPVLPTRVQASVVSLRSDPDPLQRGAGFFRSDNGSSRRGLLGGVIPILLKRPFGHRRLAAQAEAAWRDSSGC